MATEAYSEGNMFFVDEEYSEARDAYTTAVDALTAAAEVGGSAGGDGAGGDTHTTLLADVLAKRAAAHIKLNDHLAALDDARAALKLAPTHAGAFYRKG